MSTSLPPGVSTKFPSGPYSPKFYRYFALAFLAVSVLTLASVAVTWVAGDHDAWDALFRAWGWFYVGYLTWRLSKWEQVGLDFEPLHQWAIGHESHKNGPRNYEHPEVAPEDHRPPARPAEIDSEDQP